MKRIIAIVAASAIALPLLAGSASAEAGSQFQMPGVKAPDDPVVDGFRFSLLYGDSEKMSGFDLGAFAFVRSDEFNGFGPLFAIGQVTGNSSGCMCSFGNFVSGSASGATVGFLNVVGSSPNGVNVGMVNISEGESNIDIAGLAISEKSKTQIGFLNMTKEITGIQIGLLNVANNGFFPVFPLFNYPKK